MKTAGMLIIASVTFLTANYLGGLTERRVKLLEEFLLLIRSVKTYISFSRLPLTQLLKKLEAEPGMKDLLFIRQVSLLTDSGTDFYEAWCGCVEKFAKSSALNTQDARLICSFAGSLGASDVSGQLENCDAYSELCKARIDELRPKAQSNVKIYNSIGILTAVFVMIILL